VAEGCIEACGLRARTDASEAILAWLLATILAIAFLGDQALLGLAVAVGGGVALGLSAFLSYRTRSSDPSEHPPDPTSRR
jgi:hypothetical protein